MYYTIGEAAKRMNLSPSALRYYDKEGLLPFVERSSGGIRMFQDEDFDWLEIIECLKKTGSGAAFPRPSALTDKDTACIYCEIYSDRFLKKRK